MILFQPKKIVAGGGGGPTGPDDDFGNASIEDFWTIQLPASQNSDLSVTETGGVLELVVGNTYGHDLYHTDAVPKLTQDFTPGASDFDIRTKWNSTPSAQYQGQGIKITFDNGDFVRADVYHTGSATNAFLSKSVSGTGTTITNVATSNPNYVRLTRVSGEYRVHTSADGVSWTGHGSATTITGTVASVSIFGSRSGGAGAFTAQCDDFWMV